MTRSPLSADAIFRAALRLADADGLESLTMRGLAAELGVATMSLSSYGKGKDHLLLGVVNRPTA
mgnify:CR=1 FL=1